MNPLKLKSLVSEEWKSSNTQWVFAMNPLQGYCVEYFTYHGKHDEAQEAIRKFYTEKRADYSSYRLQSLEEWFRGNLVSHRY